MKVAMSLVAFALAVPAFASGGSVQAATMSDADKSFVAKVSQGGMYEVALGTAAEKQGATQDIRDQGNTEAHDHDLVGAKLKSIVQAAGATFPSELNEEFKSRLAKITALSGPAFDRAYIADMKKIHAADGAAFKKEATGGSDSQLKAFAAETYNIVQRHIGELDVNVP